MCPLSTLSTLLLVYTSVWLPGSPPSRTFLRLVIFTETRLKQPMACKNVLPPRMKGETDSDGLEKDGGRFGEVHQRVII